MSEPYYTEEEVRDLLGTYKFEEFKKKTQYTSKPYTTGTVVFWKKEVEDFKKRNI